MGGVPGDSSEFVRAAVGFCLCGKVEPDSTARVMLAFISLQPYRWTGRATDSKENSWTEKDPGEDGRQSPGKVAVSRGPFPSGTRRVAGDLLRLAY